MGYNEQLYNQEVYNWSEGFLTDSLSDDIIFNGMGMQNANITATIIDDDNLPEIDLNKFQNPIVDGGGILNRRFPQKPIKIRGWLKAESVEELNNLIDLFKERISGVEAFLDVKRNGFYRRTKATATLSAIIDRQHFSVTAVPYEVNFLSVEPFSYNTTDETETINGESATTSTEFKYYGTAPSRPRVYMIFSSATGVDTVVYNLNSRQITVENSFVAGDVLLFDSIEKRVTLNGSEIDYLGTFPFLNKGDNLVQFTANGTSVVDVTIVYTTYYL